MFRNYLAAALRNLVRNRLYAAINIVGLSVGFAAALLIALFVRDEISYDTWIPGHERTYAVYSHYHGSGGVENQSTTTVTGMTEALKLDFSGIEEVARLMPWGLGPGEGGEKNNSLRREGKDFFETIYWADPALLRVLPLPALFGDPATALDQPDSLVLTRKMARKYFGHDNAVGETIELAHKYTFRVTAVLADLPSNTSLNTDVIASGRASFSSLTKLDAMPPNMLARVVYAFVRLKPGASIAELQDASADFSVRRIHDSVGTVQRRVEPFFVPLRRVHLTRVEHPDDLMPPPMTPQGSMAMLRAVMAVAAIITLLALINFVTLTTARGGRRAVEVGIRKMSGAERRHLMAQFLGEAFIYIILGMILAASLVKALLPGINAYLHREIMLNASQDIAAGGIMILSCTLAAILAGAYPAFFLSSLRPAAVLNGESVYSTAGARLRRMLVTFQFALLIIPMVAAGVIYWQIQYAENEGLRLDKDQIVLIKTSCGNAFHDEVAKLPGVLVAACSRAVPLRKGGSVRMRSSRVGTVDESQNPSIALAPIDFGFLELYGLRPLAGRFFSRDHSNDAKTGTPGDRLSNVVINQAALATFGFKSPEDAIGQTLTSSLLGQGEIVGVVTDFLVGSANQPVAPTLFHNTPEIFDTISIKLAGRNIPETLKEIERLWAHYSSGFPLSFTFFDQQVQAQYDDIRRESQLFAIFSGVAVFIACLGLLGLASFTAERRTKEIGIRKAMGAGRRDVLGLVLWEFVKPVLWANLIAWPVAYITMHRWLENFAYHIDLEPWIFLAASALALIVAVITVTGHALLVVNARPSAALRYE